MNKLSLGLLSILLIGLFIVGCSEKPTDSISNADIIKLANFALPPGATLDSATFYINVNMESDETINVHRITDTWDEHTVTWNNFGGAYAPTVYASFIADAVGWQSVDLTSLVQEWLYGTYDNFGFIMLQNEYMSRATRFNSREYEINVNSKPYLEICYTTETGTACEVNLPVADTYIWELHPDQNAGTSWQLYIGWYLGYEKQTLVKFEFTPSEPELAALGDTVWYDDNENGIQDPEEAGVEGVVVELYNCLDELLATAVTDVNGFYIFDDLQPGDYYVIFDLPEGYVFTMQDQGADDAVDSDADPTTGKTICTNLEAGENDMTWDAGISEIPVEECGDCDGKITELTLQYLGETSANIEVVTKKEGAIFSGMVDPMGLFNFVGNDKKGTMGTEISVYIDGVLNVKIHTSCSQPIAIGMVFGDFEIIEGYSRNGGLLCVYDGPGENPGDDCGVCEGKITELTLRYLGDSSADIEVMTKKNKSVLFSGIVDSDATFNFVGDDKKGTMGTEIKIYVDGEMNIKIHTSCSQPIEIGMIFGDFEVVDGYSRKGGQICTYE